MIIQLKVLSQLHIFLHIKHVHLQQILRLRIAFWRVINRLFVQGHSFKIPLQIEQNLPQLTLLHFCLVTNLTTLGFSQNRAYLFTLFVTFRHRIAERI